MTRIIRSSLLILLAGLITAHAGPPLAIRVELEPLRPADDRTAVSLTVQIAPEDRGRVGRRAWIEAEMTSDDEAVARLARAVDVDRDGKIRLDLTMTPAEYQLQLKLESADGASSGAWIGTLTVPSLDPKLVALFTPTPTPTPSPTPVRLSPTPEPAEPPAPVASPVVAAAESPTTPVSMDDPISDWGDSDPSLIDLTVVVTDRNRPIIGLARSSFAARIDGNDAQITALGDSSLAPLFLGFAVETSTSMADMLPTVSRQLARLALRSQSGGGGLLMVTADTEPGLIPAWVSSASGLGQALEDSGTSREVSVADLVRSGVEAFEGRRGRKFLIVITDGDNTSTSAQWQAAAAAVGRAGVPVMVIGLPSDSISGRTRRFLRRIAAESGGRDYLLEDVGVLELTIKYLGELIDASYALRVRRPPNSRSAPHQVAITTVTKGFDVRYPTSFR